MNPFIFASGTLRVLVFAHDLQQALRFINAVLSHLQLKNVATSPVDWEDIRQGKMPIKGMLVANAKSY